MPRAVGAVAAVNLQPPTGEGGEADKTEQTVTTTITDDKTTATDSNVTVTGDKLNVTDSNSTVTDDNVNVSDDRLVAGDTSAKVEDSSDAVNSGDVEATNDGSSQNTSTLESSNGNEENSFTKEGSNGTSGSVESSDKLKPEVHDPVKPVSPPRVLCVKRGVGSFGTAKKHKPSAWRGKLPNNGGCWCKP